MTLKETLSALKEAGSEQTRKTYTRHGVKRPMYGVSYAALEKLRKTIKRDQDLAEKLWTSGNHDARVLATMIADPAAATPATLAPWLAEADHSSIAGAVSKLACKTPHAPKIFEAFQASQDDFPSAGAWAILAELAMSDEPLGDEFFAAQLREIEARIHSAQNSTRYMMNSALIAIGIRNSRLEKQALAAAKRIGTVEVDHGDTACKTPDAISYIKKAVARRSQKA